MPHCPRTPPPLSLLACTIAMLALAPSAMAQAGSGMSEQMARMSGSASVADKACGGASAEQQAAGKEKQKAMLAGRGMDAAAFDKAYAAGASDAQRKWDAMSPAKQAETCAQIKQQMEAAAGQVGR